MPSPVELLIKAAAEQLRRSFHTCVLSGAGLSQASGIPTYRCKDTGLWSHPDNVKYSHIKGVLADPKGAAAFWNERRALLADARPNAAHFALKELQDLSTGKLDMVTQNVDGLLQDAGCRDVVELHGSLRRFTCLQHPDYATDDLSKACPKCDAGMRPAVTLFGEALEFSALDKVTTAAQSTNVLLVVGTSADVFPAALLIPLAIANMATVIVIDPNPPEIDTPHKVELRMPAELALPAILQAIKGEPITGL